jgi:GGDEF domain-containing protein
VKRAPALIAPALLLPLAAVAGLAHKLPASLATVLDAAPLLVFGSGALLGLFTRRARLLVGVVILALADSALVNVGSRSVFDAVALLLPLNLAVVVWLGDENPFAGRGALLFAITLLQAAIIAVLLNPHLSPVSEALDVPLASSRLSTWTGLSRLSIFSFLAALGLLVARFYLHGQTLAAGAAWALVASFLALDGVSSGGPVGVHFAAAGVLLLVGATWEPRQVIATDEITRLPTRIELMRAIRRVTSRYTVAFVEVDDYAHFRDEHGVEAAQRMLRLIAKRLRRTAHGAQAYYCEGAMFAVLFPRVPAKSAIRHLDAVRIAVEDVTVDVSVAEPPPASRLVRAGVVERTVSVTISAGVAESGKPGEDPKPVLEAAERALARARGAGMNRVSR